MKKALLVDDVKLFIELEKTLLANRSNIQIFTAASGQEAIDIHKKEMVDLILCDLYMPGMTGKEVCKIIRHDSSLKKVSIIIITTSAKDFDECLAAGANDVLLKPINPSEFMQKVGKYINIPVRRDIRILARIGVEGVKGTPSESFLGNTVNISVSGVLVETGHVISLGELVSCSFFVPGKTTPITVSGEVVRKADSKGAGMHYYGIKFVNIREEDKVVIGDYIKKNAESSV
jgi:CheY-like chemotaxis protein